MAMVNVTDLAKAVIDAHLVYENSFDVDRILYNANPEACIREACVAYNIPEDAVTLLLVADSWPGDTQVWARQVLIKADVDLKLSHGEPYGDETNCAQSEEGSQT